jgi:hypothetical protein
MISSTWNCFVLVLTDGASLTEKAWCVFKVLSFGTSFSGVSQIFVNRPKVCCTKFERSCLWSCWVVNRCIGPTLIRMFDSCKFIWTCQARWSQWQTRNTQWATQEWKWHANNLGYDIEWNSHRPVGVRERGRSGSKYGDGKDGATK